MNDGDAHLLISVLMPVYNGLPYLEEAIESVLAQTHRELELVIAVDGGSTDASADAVGALARRDPRIRPLHLPHVSRGRALNEAAAVARGRWIWIVHDDNVIMPDCLATQLAFTQRTRVNICGVCALRSGSADGVMWRPESHEAICQDLFFHLAVLPTVLMATDIVRSNPFDEEACFEDYEFLTRLASRSRMGNVQQILFKYRHHARQALVREHDRLFGDFRRLRERYFQSVYPTCSPDDYAPLATLSDNRPFHCLDDLRRAGEWLECLSQADPPALMRRMGERWHNACLRSAALGPACHSLHDEIAPAFGCLSKDDSERVKSACAAAFVSLDGIAMQ